MDGGNEGVLCRRVGVTGCFLSSGVRRVHGKKSVGRCFFLASRIRTGLPLESIRPLGSIPAPYGPDTLSVRACVHAFVHASVRACVRCFHVSYTETEIPPPLPSPQAAHCLSLPPPPPPPQQCFGSITAPTTATVATASVNVPHAKTLDRTRADSVIHADACSLPCSGWTLLAR